MRVLILAVLIAACWLAAAAPARAQNSAEPEWYLRTPKGCRLFVQEHGTGPDTVVVLHGGWGAEHSYLLDAFRGMESRYHLVFYDQRGSLRSPCPDSLVTVDAHVEDLDRLREELGLARVTLFGHSMGTTLAMLYLDAHPERVRGVVLVSPSTPYNNFSPEERMLVLEQERAKQAFFERAEIQTQLRKEGLDRPPNELSDEEATAVWRITRLAAGSIYHIDRWRDVQGGIAFFDQSAASATAASMRARGEYDFRPALRAHRCPIRVIEGDHDMGPRTVDFTRGWVEEVPTAMLVVLPRAGHNPWIDAPEEFRTALAAALAAAAAC